MGLVLHFQGIPSRLSKSPSIQVEHKYLPAALKI